MNRPETDAQYDTDGFGGLESLPDDVPSESALLIAKPTSLDDTALTLHIADRYANHDDCRIIVSTSIDADETIRQQKAISSSLSHRFGIVDATAEERIAALYQMYPTIYLPYPGELTRIVLAVWDLEGALSKDCLKIHLVLRSLTPILVDEELERVTNILERLIEQQRSKSSLTVCSVEYTDHDEATMTALRSLFDGVIWVEPSTDGQLQLEYQRTRSR